MYPYLIFLVAVQLFLREFPRDWQFFLHFDLSICPFVCFYFLVAVQLFLREFPRDWQFFLHFDLSICPFVLFCLKSEPESMIFIICDVKVKWKKIPVSANIQNIINFLCICKSK